MVLAWPSIIYISLYIYIKVLGAVLQCLDAHSGSCLFQTSEEEVKPEHGEIERVWGVCWGQT